MFCFSFVADEKGVCVTNMWSLKPHFPLTFVNKSSKAKALSIMGIIYTITFFWDTVYWDFLYSAHWPWLLQRTGLRTLYLCICCSISFSIFLWSVKFTVTKLLIKCSLSEYCFNIFLVNFFYSFMIPADKFIFFCTASDCFK